MKQFVSLASEYPELVKEWHPTKNGSLKPSEVAPKSSKKVWWLGKCGHEWEANISSRTGDHGCPYCSGNKVLSGFNDLLTKNPKLAAEWHPTRNGNLQPYEVTPTAHMKVWWLGKCGHEWEATVNHRSKGRSCPICSNRQVLVGYNDLATTQEKLAAEWHPTRNGDLKPKEVTAGSSNKVWWLGKCGHEWEAAINSRVNGRGCPVCAGRQLLVGYNDLESVNPELAKEWHPEKNGNVNPQMVIAGSQKKAWWLCENHHEWQAAIKDRMNGRGCPICSGKSVLIGYNDLATIKPELAKEWNYERNGTLTPTLVAVKSGKRVWWLCEKGHEWQATIASRSDGRGCPICNKEKQTSFPEQAIFYYISKKYPDAVNGDTKAIGKELDIYIPSVKCAIEYDGYRWHKDSELDEEKNELCIINGIMLIRVREGGLPFYNNCSCIRRNDRKNKDSMNEVIEKIFYLIGEEPPIKIDVARDESAILESYISMDKKNSLGAMFSNVAKEWHPTKNGLLTPYSFSYGSKKRVWWLGECGHEWQASIVERTTRGYGCPICSGKQVYSGINDLESQKNDIAKEWNYEKNGELSPNQVTLGSSKNVWWKCSFGHEWVATINSRVQGHGCPICARNRSLSEVTEIETSIINIKNEWDEEKNGNYDSTILSVALTNKVWWKCRNGHEWEATIKSRINGRGCPYCSTTYVREGFNDLASLYPELAAEWHPTKNNELLPSGVTSGASRSVWWLGKCGHEWEASILNRRNGSGCPYCSGHKVLSGFNDLHTSYPKLVEEWDYSANNDLLPEMVTPKSNKTVSWICAKGHTWKAKVEDRVNGNGCPVCAGKICLPGFNDLRTANPELALEWHPTKNGELKPNNITKGSGKKVWWLGKCGHEWQATVISRMEGRGCPVCSGAIVAEGINDLATIDPKLALEWHPTKNDVLKPTMVMPQSNKTVWWLGKCGHEWQAAVASRYNGYGCPICSGKRILPGYNDLATIKPELAAEWHPTKNGDLKPELVARTSHKNVWWLGKCGHEWEDSVAHRYSGRGCPICSNRRILVGYNDLATVRPELSDEWNGEKNAPLTPQMVTAGSHKKVWWLGKCGHEWQAAIKNRANGTGCPICKNSKSQH